MNWDAVGALAELLGAIAVIATLFYLAIQIRENSQMMRSTIREQRFASNQDLLLKFAGEAEFLTKLENESELSEEENTKAAYMLRAAFRLMESSEYQYRKGLFDEEEWQAVRTSIGNYVSGSPPFRKFWAVHKNEFSPGFRKCVSQLQNESAI
ncbi:MAG: hypothetical protein ACU84Q_16910 [Gammaproteobacteria bacterium]